MIAPRAAKLPQWEGRDRYYAAKHRGAIWQLMIPAELGADGADERLRDAPDADSDGFSSNRGRKAGGGLHSSLIPCLTGNLTSASSASACWTTRACSGPSTGSRPTSASTTPWATSTAMRECSESRHPQLTSSPQSAMELVLTSS